MINNATDNSLVEFILEKQNTKFISNAIICFLGVLSLSLLAQLTIVLPFTPVPITGQTLGVLIISSSFGKTKGIITTILYIFIGLIGFQVFSNGNSGLGVLLGPTGGYLLGFIFSSYFMGKMSHRKLDRSFKTSIPIFLIGHMIIFTFGLFVLSFFVGMENVLKKGFYPFLPGMILKTLLAGFITPTIWKVVHHHS